ncbi:MAG: lipoprotein [Burkholderiaceae bacterium]|nr:lipoprotein [Burkholderiaceae bacterium]MCD8517248.1 lipoprotein [Burkholderiaceae bacterium]MCD8536599.1 lipoprotein [Burkholderiaceae bacterium]
MTSVADCIVRQSRLIPALVLFASLIGCGYKGPLYLPPPPDTISGQGSVVQTPEVNIPPESQNPSLEPAPIVIE